MTPIESEHKGKALYKFIINDYLVYYWMCSDTVSVHRIKEKEKEDNNCLLCGFIGSLASKKKDKAIKEILINKVGDGTYSLLDCLRLGLDKYFI